jgi:FkbM family methyltransferase
MPLADRLHQFRGRWRYLVSLPGFRAHPLTTISRALSWRVLCALRRPATVHVPAWNARIRLAPEWHGAGVTLFYVVRELYEPELTWLSKFLQPGETFIDAGANCGLYTVAAANLVGPSGRIFAFEPGRESLAMLRQNVALNKLSQVTVLPVALSDSRGIARLYAHVHGASSFSLGHSPGTEPGYEEIQTDTLDSVLQKHGVARVQTIKMDVEGAEELILRGATHLFSRCLPRVLFEINPPAISNLRLSVDGAWQFLATHGYTFSRLSPDGVLHALHAPPGDGGNVVALPGEARS